MLVQGALANVGRAWFSCGVYVGGARSRHDSNVHHDHHVHGQHGSGPGRLLATWNPMDPAGSCRSASNSISRVGTFSHISLMPTYLAYFCIFLHIQAYFQMHIFAYILDCKYFKFAYNAYNIAYFLLHVLAYNYIFCAYFQLHICAYLFIYPSAYICIYLHILNCIFWHIFGITSKHI